MTSTLIQAELTAWLRGNQWQVQNGHMPKAHAVIGDPPYFLGSITKRFGGKNATPPKWAASENPSKWNRDGEAGANNPYNRVSKGFMGKTWDGFSDVWEYQAWVTEWASLLLDYVYPGAVLALFGGTRTFHRLAAGLEDAGWEIFDCLAYLWVYGSGFPKNHNIGKAIDRADGAEREIVGTRTSAYGNEPVGERGSRAGGGGGVGLWLGGDAQSVPLRGEPVTDAAKQWDGYGTHLKPSFEPIILARAPRGSATYAELAQTWGTGALNIDGGRIGTGAKAWTSPRGGICLPDSTAKADLIDNPLGRYPANLALDEDAARMLDAMSGERASGGITGGGTYLHDLGGGYGMKHTDPMEHSTYGDSGGASRFFYTAKASAWEREAGLHDFTPQIVNDGRDTPVDNAYQRGDSLRRNTHPTVKPIQLITWLATLLLPPPLDVPRRVLMPFAGSGSEMIGAQLAGWDEIIGIEREAEYCAINEARRAWWSRFQTYDQAELAYRPLVLTTDDFSDLPLFASL